jgi:predicted transposase/invertase (TIGR01784 family)
MGVYAPAPRSLRSQDAEAFVRNLARKMPLYEDQLMTIAEQLEQKGLEQGLKKGLKKGLEQGLETGRQEGKREVARNLILKGMEMQLVKELTGLSDHDLAQISH